MSDVTSTVTDYSSHVENINNKLNSAFNFIMEHRNATDPVPYWNILGHWSESFREKTAAWDTQAVEFYNQENSLTAKLAGKLPFYSFLLDFRMFPLYFGVFILLGFYLKRISPSLNRRARNCIPIFFLTSSLVIFCAALALPTGIYFTFTNLWYGNSSSHIHALIANLVLIVWVYLIHRKQKYAIPENAKKTIDTYIDKYFWVQDQINKNIMVFFVVIFGEFIVKSIFPYAGATFLYFWQFMPLDLHLNRTVGALIVWIFFNVLHPLYSLILGTPHYVFLNPANVFNRLCSSYIDTKISWTAWTISKVVNTVVSPVVIAFSPRLFRWIIYSCFGIATRKIIRYRERKQYTHKDVSNHRIEIHYPGLKHRLRRSSNIFDQTHF